MLLYDTPSPAPNPRRVRVFIAEKGIEVPRVEISIGEFQHKSADYLAINPLGQTPALVLDDGHLLTESLAICRYLEALHPEPALFGKGALGAAEVEMWTRRAEMRLYRPVILAYLHTHPFTANYIKPQYKEFGEGQRMNVLAVMREFDAVLGDREWLDGRSYTIADIVLLTTVDFAFFAGIDMPGDAPHLREWHGRASSRSSASA